MELTTERKSLYDIDQIFLNRHSSRQFSEEPVTENELNKIFEAASWAPSCYNNQSWRFIYSLKSDPIAWSKKFDLLMDLNKDWVVNASALILVVSYKKFPHNKEMTSPSFSFDTGAACAYLQLQASQAGLVAHPMAGFDYAKAHEEFVSKLSDAEDYKVECMIAVGKASSAPEQKSVRNPLSSFVFKDQFETTD